MTIFPGCGPLPFRGPGQHGASRNGAKMGRPPGSKNKPKAPADAAGTVAKADKGVKADQETTAEVEAARRAKKAAAEAKKKEAEDAKAAKARAKTHGVIDALTAAPEGSLGHELAKQPDPRPGEDFASYTARLAETANSTQVSTNLVRLKVGLYLLANRP
ncbi:MAG: hypothetical protein FJ100_11145, partial [Deltaproteobacteria bacterium]|nr:hypothetical protein [Deltaproteobacteria bacterium]